MVITVAIENPNSQSGDVEGVVGEVGVGSVDDGVVGSVVDDVESVVVGDVGWVVVVVGSES